MKKLITLLENEMSEVTDVYDNVNFKDNVVGNSKPSKDKINTALLRDIQTAAKDAGVKVDITTAVSGHDTGTRHESGNAVDIAIINNKAVSLSNRDDADKFVDALVQLGYKKNVESGNPKSVLTFGFKGHNNHVHVSNKGGTSSTDEKSKEEKSKEEKSKEEKPESSAETFASKFMSDIITKAAKPIFGFNESKEKRIQLNIEKIRNLIK